MGFASDIIFGLVIKKPNKTGVMSVVHLSTLCGMHHCCAVFCHLSPPLLTHGSRWCNSACASWCTAQEPGGSHSSASKALKPHVTPNSHPYLSNPQVGRLLVSVFFHVMGELSEFVLTNKAGIWPFLSCKVSVLLFDDK